MSTSALTRRQLFAYALLAAPLAMAALPVYVHVPKLYGDTLGVPLALVGAILLAVRVFDAVQDPLIGYLSDRSAGRPMGRRRLIIVGLPLLAGGFVALFHPPALGGAGLASWLAAALVVAYIGFSLVSISYFAIGAELSIDYHERTRITATRGGIGVLGVLVAAAAPALLGAGSEAAGLALFSLLFLPVLLGCALATLRHTPRHPVSHSQSARPPLAAMFAPLRNPRFRWLMAVFVVSGIASAIPGTLILFFVQDVLHRPALAGLFLGLYFLFGALGMPAWVAASRRMGKKNAWLLGMVLAVAAFISAWTLGSGDTVAFALVCALSGIAYGAELAIPPSILADAVDADAPELGPRPDGAYFGLWQMIEKLNLALAAGIALPLLAFLDYQPGTPQQGFSSLSFTYALLPCVVKVAATLLLWIAPIDIPDARRPVAAAKGVHT